MKLTSLIRYGAFSLSTILWIRKKAILGTISSLSMQSALQALCRQQCNGGYASL
jgi:hypothetical protein